MDYRILESKGGRNIVVQKFGQNVADLVLVITSMRFDEIDPSMKISNVTIDPAECKWLSENITFILVCFSGSNDLCFL